MNRNPYASPQTGHQVVDVPLVSLKALYRVARLQRRVMDCVFLQAGLLVLMFLLPVKVAVAVVPLLLLPMIVGAILAFLAAFYLDNWGTAVVCLVLSCIPILGLLVLLTVSAKASRVLCANGFDGGLLGANLAEIRAAIAAVPSESSAVPGNVARGAEPTSEPD